jgi:carbamoylphosphate synthase large subunit
MEFDRFYPLLGELTPKSRTVTLPERVASAARKLGFPLFVKGAVKSNKEQGWRACIAENMRELTYVCEDTATALTRGPY